MKLFYRVMFYIVGQFILAMGVAFAANSHLGVSPVNSFPFAISAVTGIRAGICVSIVFSIYVLLQMVILRKDFQTKNLLQVTYAFIFGYFVDLSKALLGTFSLADVMPAGFAYFGQLLMLAISIVLIAFGLSLYLGADIVPMPMEGMTLAIVKKLNNKITFHNLKIILDCASVLMAILVLLVGLGFSAGFATGVVREGTVVTALTVGPVMGLIAKFLKPWQQRLCFTLPEDAKEVAEVDAMENDLEYE